uniref:Ig-like domain-containing protein n=1 Tax=Bursaphelenchus xylophilus TaxID=6326 RepID=A0A1I7ST69_BURXY
MGVFDPGQYGRTIRLFVLYLASITITSTVSLAFSEGHLDISVPGLEAPSEGFESSVINLNLQDAMRTLRRMKRMTAKPAEDILTLDKATVNEAQRKLNESDGEALGQDSIYCLRLVVREAKPNKYTVRSSRPSRCEPGRQNLSSPSSPSSSESSQLSPEAGRLSRSEMELRKFLRLDPTRRQQPRNDTGKCVISADQAVHYCGFTEEVTAPIIPPPQQGKCHVTPKSGREICFPTYETLDTTCTDPSPNDLHSAGPVPPPVIKHATVRAMAFVAPDDLQRLIKQYYRQNQQPIPKDLNYNLKPYLFARYRCDYGYELVDEVDTVFCSDRQWVKTLPECRGKGPCAHENGGCSHSCISPDNSTVECRCPKGLILDVDDKTCIKPAPKNECKNLQGCSCESINDLQLSCTCRPSGTKCLLQKGAPKIYLHPPPPYQTEPGGSLNITCSGVGYPFPETTWTSNNDQLFGQQKDPTSPYNSQISVTDVVKNGFFTCTSTNKHGQAEKVADIVVAGPDATNLDKVDSDRTSVEVHWTPPDHVNRPITHYTIYYTNNPQQPVKNWKSVDVNEPNRNFVIEDLRSDTEYTFRVRANDNLGPGKLSNAVTAKTQEAAKRPAVEIVEGEELRVSPNEAFTLNCNVIRGDPTPVIVWESKGRPISNPQEGRSIALQHKGLLEETSFLCVAENEAGKTSRRIHVVVTGPTAPERIRANVDGDDVGLQWEPPRITNGPIENYEVLYTDDPDLPEDQWKSVNSDGKTSILIPDLKELTDYTFRVKGKNANGVGLPSRDYNATTWLKPRPPSITLKPESDIEAKPSTDELVIECEATGVPKPKIAWFWDDNLVSDGENDFRVYDVSKMDALNVTNSKLIARSTTRTGKARCEAVNKEGTDEKEINVKILGPGTPPKDIHPQPEENGIKVEWKEPDIPNGNVNEYIVYYSKDPDSPLDQWQKVAVPADKTVAVIGDREEDTPYVVRVQAKTDDGPGIISEPIEVTTGKKHIPLTTKLEVLDPVPIPGAEIVVEPGQKIKFRCVTEGRPTPSLSYNWLPLDNTESGEEPIHIRTNPVPDVEHTYRSDETETQTYTKRRLVCQSRNPDGSVDDSVTFDVKKPGSPPVSIDPDVAVDNKVTIKWKPPIHPNGDLTGYKVYLSADPSKPLDQWQTFDVPTSEDPQIQFGRGELEPDTPYHVQVAAINTDGEGVKSDPIPFQTQSGAPIDAPTDLLATVAQDNSVNLSWTGPSQPNGPIQGYTIYQIPADDTTNDDNYKNWPQIPVKTTDDIGNITMDKDVYQILPNREYRIRITATNDQSEGPPSETLSYKTGTGEIPPTITLKPADNPAKVPPRGDLTVTCSATGIPEPNVYWIVDGEKTNSNVLQLSGLIKDKVVECKAENTAGDATEPLRIDVQGPGTPPVITSLQSLPDQELTVEWTTPDEPNGQITNYIVRYGEIPEGETSPTTWEEITVPSNQVETTITGLKPKATYVVKVDAVSDRGRGVESDTQRAKTLPITPPPPQVSKVDVHPNNTIAIQFDAVPDPENPATKIKNYKIHYTSDDPLTEGTEWKEMTWTHPDDSPTVSIPIDGDNFEPNKKYNIKITPEGEITGTSSDPLPFETGSGVIAPEKPTFNVDTSDNKIKVPAGTDYSVTCSSDGRPSPKITWVDADGNVISEGPVLTVNDIKTTKNVKCRAENVGGTEETPFEIYVAGPGDAPEITNIHAHKPRTIEVRWDPPKIPNGEITRYIVYYTPLDDQDPARQVGQVPSKPISEWLTHHVVGENLNDGEKETIIKDFVDPETSYAVVIQAVNDDGPGPYSVQQNIRTMSKAQEGPPTDLRVEPIDQNSAEIDWKAPENVEENPIGYEIFYVPANKEIEIDEFDSLPKWTKISVEDGDATSHVLKNELQPDTEYVFKIRAIYPKGPGVFSEPCITKTLPEGNPPVIMVSSGGEGTEGTTKIDLLPGSSLVVFCNGTGSPSPSVNWIRQGSIPIDPSTVKNEGYATRWSLNVGNITEDTTFNCVAQNPLGKANWTIDLHIVDDLPENWKNKLITAKKDGDDIVVDVNDKVKESLKDTNTWTLKITDDPSKPKDEWRTIESDGKPLDDVRVDDTIPGKTYYVTVTDPNTGLESTILSFVTPKPAEIVNVGANIDDDMVVDFKPAVGLSEVESYDIKSWPSNDPSNVRSQRVDPTKLNGNQIPDLLPDTDYNFQIVTNFKDGSKLEGDQVSSKTPPQDVKCDCSHACRLEKDDSGKSTVKCYCPQGYELEQDGKTCKKVADTETKQIVVEVTPTYEDKAPVRFDDLTERHGVDGSPLPTNEYGKPVYVDDDVTSVPLPTDSLGREIRPIVRIDGSRLPVDSSGNTLNQLGQIIDKNDEGQPLGPDNEVLSKNLHGDWLYPEIDNHGHPLPFDKNGRHVYPVIGSDGNALRTNEDGQRIDRNGEPIPTNPYGKPIGPDGSPLPTDAEKNFRWNDDADDITDEPLPTDAMGHIVYPIVNQRGTLLPLNDEGHHVDENGVEVPTNEYGFPVHPQTADILPKNSQGQYVLSDGKEEAATPDAQEQAEDVTPTERHAPIYDTSGDVLPTNYDGDYLDKTGNAIQKDSMGRPVDSTGKILPTNSNGDFVLPDVLPTDASGKPIQVVDPRGQPLPTDNTGRPLAENGSPIEIKDGQYVDENGSPLPNDRAGNVVFGTTDSSEEEPKVFEYPIVDVNGYPLPKDEHDRFVDSRGEPFRKDENNRPLGPDGQILPTDASGNYIYTPEKTPTNIAGQPVVVKGPDHEPVQTDEQGRPLDSDGNPLLIRDGQYVNKDGNVLPLDPDGNALLLPTDDSGKFIYPIHDVSGNPLPTDSSGHHLAPDGELVLTDAGGRPLDSSGKLLPTDSSGSFIYSKPKPTDSTGREVTPVGPDGLPLSKDNEGNYVKPDGSVVPISDDNQFVDSQGHPLPIDGYGRVVIRPDDGLLTTEITPTQRPAGPPVDASGNPIVVVNKDGNPLPTDANGYYLDQDGNPIPINGDNQYANEDGSPLPFDPEGRVHLVNPDDFVESAEATDAYGKVVYPIVDSDGNRLPKDESGRHIDKNGELIPLNDFGKPLDMHGNPLGLNEKDQYVLPSDVLHPDTAADKPIPAEDDKEDHYAHGPEGQPKVTELPTDSTDVKPTSESGKPIIVVNSDGIPLPTNFEGAYVDPQGEPIPTNADNEYVGPDSSPLPTDQYGNVVLPSGDEVVAKTLPTDTYGKEVHPIVDPQGNPLPTDTSGRHVGPGGEPIPVDEYGRPQKPDGSLLPQNPEGEFVFHPIVIPTSDSGKPIVVIGADGLPLQKNAAGNYIRPDGVPVPTNAANEYVGPDGSPLPTSGDGSVIIPAEEIAAKTLPTDSYGKPVHPMVDPLGHPLPTDETGRHVGPDSEPVSVDDSGKPIRPDGSVYPKDKEGNYVLLPHVVPTDDTGKAIEVVGPDGQPVPKNSEGQYIKEDGQPIPTNSDNEYVASDGSLLPKDSDGNVVIPAEELAARTLPTDSYGKPIHPLVDPQGNPIPTDASGRHVGPDGEPVAVDEHGRPTRPDGSLYPKDKEGNYILQSDVIPTDPTGKAVVVIGPDGTPLQKDPEGHYIKPDGKPIPTNAANEYVSADGSPLPTNALGDVIIPAEELEGKTLPTDANGKVIYPIVDPEGSPLPTDDSGRHIGPNQKPVPVDDEGRPINPDGSLLPQDTEGRYVFKPSGVPTDSSGRPIVVVDAAGIPLSKNSDGNYVDSDGVPVPTNLADEFVGPDGSPLPTNADGNVVVGVDDEIQPKTLPTDDTGKDVHPVVDQDGNLLPTDSSGKHIKPDGTPLKIDDFGRPLQKDNVLFPTDSAGNFVYSDEIPKVYGDDGKPVIVVGPDGLPLDTNTGGQFVRPDGAPINVENDRYVDENKTPLPINEHGQAVFSPGQEPEPKILPTDDTGAIVFPIVDKDGHPLPKNAEGKYINKEGELIPVDEFSRPQGPDGKLLPKNGKGQYVHPDSFPARPTDSYGNAIPVVGKDGQPLPIDAEGNFVGPDNQPIKIDDKNHYVDSNGARLPINDKGQAVYDATAKILPTDDSGNPIYPVVSADGLPLPTDYTGHYTDDRGEIIPLDDYGHPLSPDGSVLPKNELGQYVHGEDSVVTLKPTDRTGRPVVVVDKNGVPLPTDTVGNYIGENGHPVPTNSANQYVGPDGSPLPVDPEGRVVVGAGTEPEGRTLPTDDTGKVVYPIVRPDGSLLPTDSTGRYIDSFGEQIPVNDFGRPINKNTGEVLPTDQYDQHIFYDAKPTDSSGRLIQVVDKDGNLLPTDATGQFILSDGSPVPTNSHLEYIGPDSSPLPLNEENKAVHPGTKARDEILPTDHEGKLLYPIVRPDGTPLERDSSGRYVDYSGERIPIDDFGRPIDKDKRLLPKIDDTTFVYAGGVVLPTDASGKLIRVIDPDGQPLPTSIDGLYVSNDGNVIPTDNQGNYLGPDGLPLPISDDGTIVYSHKHPLPTDKSGRSPLPVVDENGSPRPTDLTGRYLDFNGVPLEVDENGIPQYPDGTPLKQDDNGNYVYQDQRAKDSKHCYMDRYVEIILVIDTSENVKILEYRLMKETIKSFLKENFDLGENKVRIGLIKYGSEVDVPVALGDYSNAGELLRRIGDTRRLKGSPQLGEALRDAVSEFKISGAPGSSKVVIVFKGGRAADDVALPSTQLRDYTKADVFVVSVGQDDDDDNEIVGHDSSKLFKFQEWKSMEPSDLGPIADKICELVPSDQAGPTAWPSRPTRPSTSGLPRECSTVEYEVDLVVLLDSSKFTQEEFTKTRESIGTLVDESFDLAPDVVRVGFIVFSDKVSVPVALGHYEDKIELLEKIQESELMDGTAIAYKGLDAARQQFRLHGRGGVSKVVLLITNGNYRGNGQQFAQELRDTHGIQLFVLGINPSQARLPSLQRLVGVEFSKERLLSIENIDDISNKLDFLRTSLCSRISQTTVVEDDYYTTESHRTTKRDVTKIPLSEQKEPCKDEAKMSINIVIDSNGGSQDEEHVSDVKSIVQTFLDERYAEKEKDEKPLVNLININSKDKNILHSKSGVPVDDLFEEMSDIFDDAVKENEEIREKLPDCQH